MAKMRYGAILEAIVSVNLSIKSAPDALVATLKTRAARHHRSLQGELMAILEVAAREDPVLEQDRVEQLMAKVKAINLPCSALAAQMIREDRDGDHR